MSNTQSSIYRRTLIKDARSYIIPVLIVLAAFLFSMGNIFSVHAAEQSVTPAVAETVTVSGHAGVTVSGSTGLNLP